MKAFVVRLWSGEPIVALGAINTVVVALAVQFEWARIAALVTVPLSTFVARSQVSPNGGCSPDGIGGASYDRSICGNWL